MSQVEGERISVLVVEDEVALAEIYEIYLQPEFAVQTATSGMEALDLIDESIDVVLLDRQMPAMSGDEVLSELRNRGYDVPVAMVTAVEPDVDIVDMSFDEYLTKPIDHESLVRTVRVLANRVSFERKSREFFRLASKKASLDSDSTIDPDESEAYSELLSRMEEIRTELDDTIGDLFADDPTTVSRITPDQDEIETLLVEVGDHTLPDEVRTLVDEYQELKDARPPFMWRWVHRLAPQNTLPCVGEPFVETVPIDKTVTILFITLLDDILEKRRNRVTFNELSKIPFENQEPDTSPSGVDAEYVAFAQRVWETLLDRLRQSPNYEDYEALFRYDIKQALNALEYSELVIRQPDFATVDELERYESHNMVMFAYGDIDLMYTSLDVRDELAPLREAIWIAQLMARIGNWVSTWERELREGDYSSGPVVYALEEGIISRSELQSASNADDDSMDTLVERIKTQGIEDEFLRRWEYHYHQLRTYNSKLSVVDLEPFVRGTEEVLRYHLATTGLK